MKKKISLFIMTFLVISLSLFINCTPAEASTELVYGDGTITREEWLHDLVLTFNMTVEDDNYPDNYFSDLEDTSEYYYDMLLAVQFGLVDCEAGTTVYPKGLVTRDFAAHTLNLCLGFQLDEGQVPSFTDADLSKYPEDAQIAINRGWFALADGKFSPDTNITSDEVRKMLEDANVVLTDTVIDESHENVYDIAEGVVEVPIGTKVEKTDETTITITDCPVTIKQGNKFVVYIDELANAYIADEVSINDNITTIKISTVEDDSVFENINAEGIVDADLTQIEATDGTEIIYMDESTGKEYRNAKAAQRAVIPINRTLKATKSITLTDGMKAEVTIKMKNPKIEYKINTLAKSVYAKLRSDSEIIFKVKLDGYDALESAVGVRDIRFINWTVPFVGGFSVSLDIEAGGSVSGVTGGYLTAGLSYSSGNGFRIIKGFDAKSFTLNVEAVVACGLQAKFGITDIPGDKISAYVYAKAGAKASLKGSTYGDGKLPKQCNHFAAYMYVEYGAKGSVKFGISPTSISIEETLIDENNSPIKVVHHYEDGKKVPSCTRGINWSNGYYTKGNSRFAGSGWMYGDNSYGLDGNGEPIVIFTYTLDDDKNATITGYKGNARALVVPETIDGYTVTKIGGGVFKNNTSLVSVIIPDTIIELGYEAFSGCVNLTDVDLSKNLITMQGGVFNSCTSLVYIKIPKSLNVGGSNYAPYGAFQSCANLRYVEFENGITEIPEFLFEGCTGLQEIKIPDTVLTVESFAFSGCSNLVNIELGNSITSIGYASFSNNPSITKIVIPDSVTTIDMYAFSDCANLDKVILSNNLKTLAGGAFRECDSITSIRIPKSLDCGGSNYAPQGAFTGCSALKNVEFEEGITEIPEFLFQGCDGLEEIKIPDTVVTIESFAFSSCYNLGKIELGNSITLIGYDSFSHNPSITKIIIPDSVTTIDMYAFNDCAHLEEVILSKNLKTLAGGAFRECDSIVSIKIPKSLDYGGSNYAPQGAFTGCSALKNVEFEEGITEIPEFLFQGCDGLEEIKIPDTVVTIESFAFSSCYNLGKIELGNSITLIGYDSFSHNPSITKIVIPDSVTAIDLYAFNDCAHLEEVILSKNLKTLAGFAFGNCVELTSIKIPKSLTVGGSDYAPKGAFAGCSTLKTVEFEEGITKIPVFLFKDCIGLEEITIPDTVVTIESYAFSGCNNLKTVKMTNSVSELGNFLFTGCSNLVSVSLSNSIEQLTTEMFYKCTSLEEISIPNNVKIIARDAFGETGLKNIVIPESVESIGNDAFRASELESVEIDNSTVAIGSNVWRDCTLLSKISLGNNVKSIGEYAFYNCDQLSEVVIPDNTTKVGKYIFANNETLNNVTLGTGLTEIPEYAFFECPKLEKIVLPYRIKTIQTNAFTNCTAFNSLTIPRATTTIADTILSYPAKVTIYGIAGTYAETYAKEHNITFVNQEIKATEATLNHTELTLNNGKTDTLILTVTPSDFTDEVAWKSSDTAVVTVADTGVVTAKGVGTATIKVTVGDVSATCKVTVVQPVTSISLNKTSLTLNALDTYALTATAYPANANNKQITWSSSDEKIATVNQNGLVKAVAKGTATITAAATDGSNVTKSCAVTVNNNGYVASTVEEMESPHPYSNNCTDFWVYTLKGAGSLNVTFNENTNIEDGFDFLYVYTGDGTEVGKYTGTELAGKSINVDGDTVRIQLATDNGGPAWGFKVDSITVNTMKLEQKLTGTASYEKTLGDADFKLDTIISEGDGTLSYASNNNNVATVANDGTVSLKGVGTAVITVTASATEKYAKAEKTITISVAQTAAHEHRYGNPTFVWTGSTAIARFACTDCGEKLDKTATVSKQTIAATCTKAGKDIYTAKVNLDGTEYSDVKETTIPATGHSGGTATCTQKAVCTKCGSEYGTVTGHTGGTATCCTKAVCTKCGQAYGSFNSSIHTGGREIRNAKNPTCTQAGYTGDTYCVGCGIKLSSGSAIAKKAHQFGVWVVTKQATYTEDGMEQHNCINCGTPETRMIPKLARINISNAIVRGIGNKRYTGKAQTQANLTVQMGNTILRNGIDYTVTYVNNTNIGTATVTITGTGAYTGTLNKTFKIMATRGTTYTVKGMRYKVASVYSNGTGTVMLTGSTLKSRMTSLKVGNTVTIGGKAFKITSIGSKAFYGYKKLKKVAIGNYVSVIDTQAFSGCTKLSSVTVGSGLVKIGSKAFYGDKTLKAITIKSKKLKSVGSKAIYKIYKRAVIRVPSSKLKTYKKLFKSSTGFKTTMKLKR